MRTRERERSEFRSESECRIFRVFPARNKLVQTHRVWVRRARSKEKMGRSSSIKPQKQSSLELRDPQRLIEKGTTVQNHQMAHVNAQPCTIRLALRRTGCQNACQCLAMASRGGLHGGRAARQGKKKLDGGPELVRWTSCRRRQVF